MICAEETEKKVNKSKHKINTRPNCITVLLKATRAVILLRGSVLNTNFYRVDTVLSKDKTGRDGMFAWVGR